jgi:hypothetical protein
MSETVIAKNSEDNLEDPRVHGFLKSMYDQMIMWNVSGMNTKISLWKHLGLSAGDFVAFNSDPQKWARSYLENRWGRE